MRILIISFAYPPLNAIGAFRASKISKYLTEMGHDVHVLSANSNVTGAKSDLELEEGRIHYVDYFDLYSYISPLIESKFKVLSFLGRGLRYFISPGSNRLPDWRRALWVSPAYRKGVELIKEHNIDLIYSSSSPPACSIIASKLAKQCNVRWISEFRDAWCLNPYNTRSRIAHLLECRYEKKILSPAEALVTVSKPIAKVLSKMHNKVCHVIFNAYDKEDYSTKENVEKDKFTIVHTGSIYPGKRDPTPLFKALSTMIANDPTIADLVEVNLYGHRQERLLKPVVDNLGIASIVNFKGGVSKAESIKAQKKATILLLLTWNNRIAEGTITGKLFEYIAAARPILALSYPGVIKEVLESDNMGVVINETEHIKSFLLESIQHWKKEEMSLGGYNDNLGAREKYNWNHQVSKLSKILQNGN